MRIGVPKEIKNREARVGITPQGVNLLVRKGHQLFVETQAGAMINFTDADFEQAGAKIVEDAEGVFDASDMIVKVKEPQSTEIARLQPHQALFTYLHLAPDPAQTEGLLASGATCIAYETVTDRHGRLPLLTPMSEVAGRLSVQAGSQYLELANGGAGVLLGGATGVAPAEVLVIGGGVAGQNAATIAAGMGANVTILETSVERIGLLDQIFGHTVRSLFSTPALLDELVARSDLVVGAVLLPGAAAPKVLSRSHIAAMKPGSVVVDVAIDQGGCFETSRPTSHDDPVYSIDDVTHYCVTNMPAAVARTSTLALSNATLPFVVALADKGVNEAIATDPHLAAGLNIMNGEIIHPSVKAAYSER